MRRCLRCGSEKLTEDAVREGQVFLPYRWKCMSCWFQLNLGRDGRLTYRACHGTPWLEPPKGALAVFGRVGGGGKVRKGSGPSSLKGRWT